MRRIDDYVNKRKLIKTEIQPQLLKRQPAFTIPLCLMYPLSTHLPILKRYFISSSKPYNFPTCVSITRNTHHKYLETSICRLSPIPMEYSFENSLLSYTNLKKLEIQDAKSFDFELMCNTKITALLLKNVGKVKNTNFVNQLTDITLKNLKDDTVLMILKYLKIKYISIAKNARPCSSKGSMLRESFARYVCGMFKSNDKLEILKLENFLSYEEAKLNVEVFQKLKEFSLDDGKVNVYFSYFSKIMTLKNIRIGEFIDLLELRLIEFSHLRLYECELDFEKIIAQVNPKCMLLNTDNYGNFIHCSSPKTSYFNSKMKSLVLSNCVFNNKAFKKFLSHFDSLEYIDISNSTHVDFMTVEFIARKFKKSLRYLDFSGVDIWGDFLAKIRSILGDCKVVYRQIKVR